MDGSHLRGRWAGRVVRAPAFLGTVLAPPIWVPIGPSCLAAIIRVFVNACTATVPDRQTDRGLDISTVLTVLKGCRASESYHSYTMCSSFETELLPPVEEGRVSWTGPTNKCEPKIGRA
jgi:hypothetical protein